MITKEQKAELINKLSSTWGAVALMCDGFRVDLQVQRWKGMSYRVMTFVNGVHKGAWFSADKEHPEQKFLRKSVRPILSPAKRIKLEKTFGKRYVKNDPYWSGSITLFMPDWASGKAAINHLCKVCESVEIAPAEERAQ